jgi:hypothetical protein
VRAILVAFDWRAVAFVVALLRQEHHQEIVDVPGMGNGRLFGDDVLPILGRRRDQTGEGHECLQSLFSLRIEGFLSAVIPAKAGIQGERQAAEPVALDSRFRGNDGGGEVRLLAKS